jgi:SAM-dependent methyltransferase
MVDNLKSSYDRVAPDYAKHFCNELDKKPFDRKMLDWLVERVGGAGVICDMGCGPGHIAGYLHSRGQSVCGVELSPAMVEQARALNPEIPFQEGDMLELADVADGSYAAIAAFYSIVHIPRDKIVQALQELKRVLQPRGMVLLAFHLGREVRHLDELLDHEVSLDFFFFETAEMKNYLRSAGFELEEAIERDPYPRGVEYQSRRAYIFARRP